MLIRPFSLQAWNSLTPLRSDCCRRNPAGRRDDRARPQNATGATRGPVVGTDLSSAPPEIREWKFHFSTGVIKGEVYNYPGHEDAAPISTSQVARASGYVFFTQSGSRYQLADPADWFKREMELRGHWDEDSPLETILALSPDTREDLRLIDRESSSEEDSEEDDDDSDDDEIDGEDDPAVALDEAAPPEEEEEDEEEEPPPRVRPRRGSVRRITYGR